MKKMDGSHISENWFPYIETDKKNSNILDERENLLGAIESLIQTEKMEEGLQRLFQFLKEFLPITYVLYTPPYESQLVDHIYISEEGIRFFDNQRSLSHDQITKIFNHREYFNNKKTYYFSKNENIDKFISIIINEIKIKCPCFYFYFMHNGQVQGSIYFGCSAKNEFTPKQRHFLERLWNPLYFITRFFHQQSQLESILKITQENNISLRKQVSGFPEIIGANSGLKDVAKEIRLLAPFDIPVLLTGESGTGKDLFATELHRLSPRRNKPFVAVNCGGIAPTLLDSELFGYTKGAFTGALKDYKGRFERAQGGTVFLDEIAELPLVAQTRLLRVILKHVVEKLGGSAPLPVDFRIVCATNKNLREMVQRGTFREDLYFRLAGVTVHIPPLRKRPGDIPLLVQTILHKESVRYRVPVPIIAAGEMQKLLNYSWPGNVRELIHVVTEGFVRSFTSGVIIFRTEHVTTRDQLWQTQEKLKTFTEIQREYFSHLLQVCNGRISGKQGAAELAGLKPNTMRAKLDKLNIPYGHGASVD